MLLLALVRTTRVKAPAAGPSQLDRTRERMATPPPDSGELALVRELELSKMSAFHLHVRLRPVLREIAATRSAARYGVELDSSRTRARELVGERRLGARPPRPAAARASGSRAGPTLAQLRAVVDELETVYGDR